MQNLKIYIHQLIRIRNRIFNTLKACDEMSKEGGMNIWYSKNDYSILLKEFTKLNMIGLTKPHNLWEIAKKETKEDKYVDDVLSVNSDDVPQEIIKEEMIKEE